MQIRFPTIKLSNNVVKSYPALPGDVNNARVSLQLERRLRLVLTVSRFYQHSDGCGLTCDGGVRCDGVCGPSILIRDGRRQSDLYRILSQSIHVRPAMFPSQSFGQHLAPSVQNAIRLRPDLVVIAIDRKCDLK